MDEIQKIQESQYHFPYHYLVRFGDGVFSQVRQVRWGYIYASYVQFILKRLSEEHFDTLLDIGCGDGKFVFEARRTFPQRVIDGVDYSEQAIQFARAFNPTSTFYAGDITKAATVPQTYDAATLVEVLEHIPPPEVPEFVKAVSSLLKEKGLFLISVPCDNDPVSEKHYQHFNKETLEEAVGNYFEIEHVYYLNKRGTLDGLIYTLLSNRIFILNQYTLVNKISSFYQKHLLNAEKHNAKRIVAVCRKK